MKRQEEKGISTRTDRSDIQDSAQMNEHQSWNVLTVFCLLLFGLTAATLLHRQSDFSERENRSLAQRPRLTLSGLLDGSFEEDYEDYLSDQFIGRDSWISLKTWVQRLTGHTEDNDVYFADDDYLIEKHTGTFTSDTASVNIDRLSQFADIMVQTYGTEHVTVMIAPNAVDILKDKLPALASPYDEETYLEQIASSLPEDVYLDLQEVLEAHKDEELYYRTDHHWKTLSAWYAYQAYAASQGIKTDRSTYDVTEVTDSFEGTVAAKVGGKVVSDTIEIWEKQDGVSYLLTYNQTDDIRSTVYQKSALEGRDKYAYFYGGNYALIQASTSAQTGRRLLVIKDSYAHCFVPFLYNEYDQVDMVDLRYYNASLHTLMEEKDYTDVLFLYNASGFAEDTSLNKLLM